MAVSTAALILIVSIMGGFGQAIKKRLAAKEAHLAIYFNDNPFAQTNPLKTAQAKSLLFDKEEPPAIFSHLTSEQKKGIQSAVVFETQDLILKSQKKFKGVSAIGYSQSQWDETAYQALFEPSNKAAALPRYPRHSPSPLTPLQDKETLLSHELALEMDLAPGDEAHFIPLIGLLLPPNIPPPIKRFKIKGLLPAGSTQKEALFIYHKQGLMDFGDFSKINYRAEIQLYNPEEAPVYQNLFKNYKTQTWMERNSTLFFTLKLEKFMMTLLLGLAVVISCLGMSSALFLLMTQKKDDMAILHAMGLSPKQIVKIFTGVGLSLAFISLLAGALIGLSGTVFLKYSEFNFLPEMYQDRTLPAVFMPFNYLMILSGALLLAWISCRLPTKHFSRINPAELLKAINF